MLVEELEGSAELGEMPADREPGGAGSDDRGVEECSGHDDLQEPDATEAAGSVASADMTNRDQAGVVSPCSNANAVAAARFGSPSFARMLPTCRATVRSLRNRSFAISRFDRPRAMSRSTSISRRREAARRTRAAGLGSGPFESLEVGDGAELGEHRAGGVELQLRAVLVADRPARAAQVVPGDRRLVGCVESTPARPRGAQEGQGLLRGIRADEHDGRRAVGLRVQVDRVEGVGEVAQLGGGPACRVGIAALDLELGLRREQVGAEPRLGRRLEGAGEADARRSRVAEVAAQQGQPRLHLAPELGGAAVRRPRPPPRWPASRCSSADAVERVLERLAAALARAHLVEGRRRLRPLAAEAEHQRAMHRALPAERLEPVLRVAPVAQLAGPHPGALDVPPGEEARDHRAVGRTRDPVADRVRTRWRA